MQSPHHSRELVELLAGVRQATVDPKHPLAACLKSVRETAFRELYEHFRPRLVGLLIRRGVGYEDAEDVTQGVLPLLDDDRCEPTRNIEAWLRECACNRAQDLRRRSWRCQPFPAVVNEDGDRTPGELVVEDHRAAAGENDEALAAVEEALRQLEPQERDVLRLRYLEKQSREETAERLSISSAKVDRLRASGLRNLRAALARSGFPHSGD
jgi:RNA polymerase sigma-70 factor (ECF subfamily)